MTTDDPEEAYAELRKLRAQRDGVRWDMAEVRQMADPPRTANRYCVFAKSS